MQYVPGSLFSEANASICTNLDVCVQLCSLTRPSVFLFKIEAFNGYWSNCSYCLFLFEQQCIFLNTEENVYSRLKIKGWSIQKWNNWCCMTNKFSWLSDSMFLDFRNLIQQFERISVTTCTVFFLKCFILQDFITYSSVLKYLTSYSYALCTDVFCCLPFVMHEPHISCRFLFI